MTNSSSSILILLLLLSGQIFRFAEGGKRRIHIADDLDDVIDDEEDEAWKQWGKISAPSSHEFDPPPSDLSNIDMSQMQELMMKQQHLGPVFGFVKLRLGVRRTPVYLKFRSFEITTESLARVWFEIGHLVTF